MAQLMNSQRDWRNTFFRTPSHRMSTKRSGNDIYALQGRNFLNFDGKYATVCQECYCDKDHKTDHEGEAE